MSEMKVFFFSSEILEAKNLIMSNGETEEKSERKSKSI